MPIAELRGRDGAWTLSGGYMLSWYRALATQLGLELQFVVRPRRRLESALDAGEADLLCRVRPDWVSAPLRTRLRWFHEPFLEVVDQLVAGPGVELPASLEALEGVRVGTVLGFRYPALQAQFDQGTLRRDDALNEGQLAEKLLRGHDAFAMMDLARLHFVQQGSARGAQLRPTGLGLSRQPAFCALAPGSRLDAPPLEAAQAALLRSAAMRRLLQGF